VFRFLKILTVLGLVSGGANTKAGVISFIDDYEGFLAAAGDVQTIGFEILPDGSPTNTGAELTPEFNYTDWGVTFSSPVPTLGFQGNTLYGYGLVADSYPTERRNWIIADLVTPATAVGVFYTSTTTLSVFDTNDILLASEFHTGPGTRFLGFVSDIPIVSATVDNGSTAAYINSFHFTPIPEPATLALLGIGGTVVLARRNRRYRTRR